MARLPYLIPYDPDFLGGGFRVPLPATRCRGNLTGDGMVLDYIHASLVMHRQRRSAVYAAHNIDVSQRQVVAGDSWALDDRIPSAAQTGPGAYLSNPWDRGHLVRRAAVAWGSPSRAQDASDATYFYTNASPQHERFNRDEWVHLEDWVLDTAGGASNRLCVFTGPLFTTKDQTEGDTRIPSAFWKIIVLRDPVVDGSDLAVLGFVMKQNDFWEDWNGSSLLDLHVYQVGISDIGVYTGLEFSGLAQLDEFEWRQVRFRDRSRMGPIPIRGPEDVDLVGTRRRRERGVRALRYLSTHEAAQAGGALGEAESGRASATAVTGTTAPLQAARPAGEGSGDCGCRGADSDLSIDEQVEALGRQVAALRDLVEGLLEEDQTMDERTRSDLRHGARRTFARIVGGQMVGYGEFPDCACIGLHGGPSHLEHPDSDLFGHDTEWFCSGVLISDRVVVTAAHCAPSINRAFLGGRSLSYLGVDGEVARVERVLVHPEYHPDLVPSHDIAVLVLAEPVTTAPAPIATLQHLAAQDDVMLVGFGYDHPTANVGFGTKRKVSVRLTNTSGDPAELVAALELNHGFESAWEFHAGIKGLGKDSCNGDSGGPAYVESEGTFLVAGITSRAAFSADTRCGDGGIYTRITPYLGWIHEATDGLAGVAVERPEPGPRGSTVLYVSAAQPNPAGPDDGYEWIEITNGGAVPLALDDYVVTDKQGGQEPLGGAIAAGATYRMTLPEGSKVKLANSGDEIVLLRGEAEIHRVSYAAAGKGEVIRFEGPESGASGVVPDPCAGSEQPAEGLPADADPC